ncbi:cysteine hydrolase family protein [Janibacter sp. GS2]|uniref:cysteine hydrolase family protein n=1 Tax=Janibacter sp. GS2 TaxID=3442646 RepID=UPI003EBF985A
MNDAQHPIGTTFSPATSALVVIDMQNAFLDPDAGFRFTPPAREIVAPINHLARWFRESGSRVVWVQTTSRDDPDDWPSLRRLLGATAMDHRTRVLSPGSPGHRMWPGMDVQAKDDIVLKHRYSAMIEPDAGLEELLRVEGVNHLFIAGTQTNICCESTARDAMMRGFDAWLVRDCLAAEDEAVHAASVAHYESAFGRSLTSAEVRHLPR